jgi:hypothetical protein
MRIAMLLSFLLLAACANSPKEPDRPAGPVKPADQPEPTKEEDPVEQLRKDIKEVAARPERKADTIQVQHLLVAHGGAGIGGVTRSMADAEKLAAELYAKIQAGEDFDALVKEHTDDSHPGIYGMTMKGDGDSSKGIYKRSGMVAAFGDVGWRLDVGQVGVAPYDARKSPYGWHIIKRLK